MGCHRAFIRHLSTINPAMMNDALSQVLKYIWKELPCEHVRAELIHIRDDETGRMAADPVVKAAYTTNGFKWKTLSNDPTTGKRA